MDAATVADVFAALLLGGLAATAAIILRGRSTVTVSTTVAAVVAVGATAGSLYFSEVADFVPCELCWFQRIFMYPLAVLAPIEARRRRGHGTAGIVTLATIGLAVSIYHVVVQLRPETSTSCDILNPCSAAWVEGLGFATIPMMAGASFVLVIAHSLLARRS